MVYYQVKSCRVSIQSPLSSGWSALSYPKLLLVRESNCCCRSPAEVLATPWRTSARLAHDHGRNRSVCHLLSRVGKNEQVEDIAQEIDGARHGLRPEIQKGSDHDRIRTCNRQIWSLKRYRCATRPTIPSLSCSDRNDWTQRESQSCRVSPDMLWPSR